MPTSRRRQSPATGTVSWQHNCPETGNRVLRITVTRKDGKVVAQEYEVEVRPPTKNNGKKVLGGYNLYRLDDATFGLVTYHITVDEAGVWWCDCPDSDMDPLRTNHCKHTRALKAALAALPF